MLIVCLFAVASLSGAMSARQMKLLEATQKRINFTSEILGSMKSVKMLGLSGKLASMLDGIRDREIDNSKSFRRVSSTATVICASLTRNGAEKQRLIFFAVNACFTVSQVFTFATYAIASKVSGRETFSVAQAVTALSILNVLLVPLAKLLFTIPQSFSALGCFQRIQEFLQQEDRHDQRHLPSGSRASDEIRSSFEAPLDYSSEIELQQMRLTDISASRSLSIVNGSFGWGTDESKVLNNVSMSVSQRPTGSLTIIIGPVGSGKSSLLRALIGEVDSTEGEVSVGSPRIAYCEQTPWIMNATIKENIIAGTSVVDEEWYKTVVHACDLESDFKQLQDGDSTLVGSKGIKLSGGQKQRLVGRNPQHQI
jgi:ATP-binding cassette, subfamily C (CFTR/MRP), member 1